MEEQNRIFLGADLGGTKLLVGEMDQAGSLLRHKRYASGHLGQREALELIQRSIDDFLVGRSPTLAAIGLGLIGRVDSENGIWLQIDHDRAEALDMAGILEQRYGVPLRHQPRDPIQCGRTDQPAPQLSGLLLYHD